MFEALSGPPLLWSAEQPHLYLVVLELKAGGAGGEAAASYAAAARHEAETIEFESCQVRVV